MKNNFKEPPRIKALMKSTDDLIQRISKRLEAGAWYHSTQTGMLEIADKLIDTGNKIYRACGKECSSVVFAPEITNERFTALETAFMEFSKQKVERSDRQAKQSTVKRTIIHEEITENEECESTASVETESTSYKSQFVKSFGNRIFEAQKRAEKNPTEFQCIKDLLKLINSYVYKRFRKQYPELGIYLYSLEQIKQFTIIIVLKYAAEYSHNPYNAKKFKEEMNGWIDRIGKDKEVTVKESLPKCLHKFDIERDVQLTPTVMYIWWLLCDELKNAKRTKNETIDFDELFDYEYIDNLAEKINPDVFSKCEFPLNYDEVSKYIE